MAYKKLKLWFDIELAKMLSNKIQVFYSDFNSEPFIRQIDERVQPLELKDRVNVIADSLHDFLPYDYSQNIELLISILGPENPREEGMFTDYYWVMPVASFVERYGLNNFDISMNAIKQITMRNTGEYTIRPFIRKYQNEVFEQLMDWTSHENSHVRRLCSEGIRPRLPWSSKLDEFVNNPKPILSILDKLMMDNSRYVQKSVGNCLNDILKDNIDIGKSFIDKWSSSDNPNTKWIIRHAIRNLIKREDSWALTKI